MYKAAKRSRHRDNEEERERILGTVVGVGRERK
jgi:hypothetical protein